MVKAGMFGELTHGACAYNHDLRSDPVLRIDGEGLWRRFEHLNRNGNLYPTHGLGPVAHYMDINRGDRFEYLVSMSSHPAVAAGLSQGASCPPTIRARRKSTRKAISTSA